MFDLLTPVVFAMKVLTVEESANCRVDLMVPCAKYLSVVGVSANLTAGRVWPASVVLAKFLIYHRQKLKDQWIFEFGAGIAIPSMAALKSGAVTGVYLQDLNSPALLAMQKYIFESNDLAGKYIQCPMLWGSEPDLTDMFSKHGMVGLFVAADCLYSRDDFAVFSKTVAHFLKITPNVSLVTVYQDRNHLYCLDETFEEHGLKYQQISLSSFGVSSSTFESATLKDVVDDFPSSEELEKVLIVLEITLKSNTFGY